MSEVIRTFWVWHKEADVPDCELGWSQFSVDNNPEEWERQMQGVRDHYGDGIHSEREIEISLSTDAVLKCWWPDPIDGEVESGSVGHRGAT